MPAADTIITLDAGSYRLCAPIASSAYGVVWRASALADGKDVALKLINQTQMALAGPLQRERWSASAYTEIAFLRSLSPWDERHIVRLLDSGLHEGLPVLALELMACDLGRQLAGLRQQGRAPSFAQVLDWIEQIHHALAKVHQYGWRYLDLKPANVLLDASRRRIKLADFGTNRLRDDTLAHSYAGTANWQAPEQFFPSGADGYRTDTRTDYFALGALFYYLVSGGVSLRFCRDCARQYQAQQQDGTPLGRPPAMSLQADEAALFSARIERTAHRTADGTWCPAGATSATALALLRTLLDPDPARRPRNALHISRMLRTIRASLTQQAAQADMTVAA